MPDDEELKPIVITGELKDWEPVHGRGASQPDGFSLWLNHVVDASNLNRLKGKTIKITIEEVK